MSRNFKIKIVFSLSLLLILALAAGCGTALKESGGDQTGIGDGIAATAEFVGLDNCYTCHNQTKFNQWAKSRHANFDLDGGTRVDFVTMKTAVGGTDVDISEIAGEPHITSYYTTGCAPCHMGPDSGGIVLDINYGEDVFTDPNIGIQNRFIISCEACHGGGSFHYGVGALPYPQPAFDQCTTCHAEVAHDHHGVDGYRYWKNAAGDNVGSSSNAATASTVTGLEVWTLPLVSAWTGTYAGPYYFEGDRTINDTHYNEIWITNEDDKVTILAVSTAKLGYVDTSLSSPNSGMVNSTSDESCTASCHDAHVFDLTKNRQWAAGAHRPIPEGPMTGTTPSAPANWGAIDHNFSSSCLRCHSSEGFAEMVPAYGSVTETDTGTGRYITCNACHDGTNYPSSANKRLRVTDEDVPLYNYDGSAELLTPDAGNSAVCIYCHQGRSDGTQVAADISAYTASPTGSALRFRNMHYVPSAAMIYAEKGYEYAGTYGTFAGQHSAHIDTAGNCVGCHMDEVDPVSETLGGHTFHVANATSENTDYCDTCHTGISSFDTLTADGDWDGDSSTESAKDEIAGLLTTLLTAIEAADLYPVDGTTDIYHQSGYPYFGKNSGQLWGPETAAAAFNWQYVYKDTGAYAHNEEYAAQLLRDSYQDLTGSALGGTRP